jgi:hypothetical protein
MSAASQTIKAAPDLRPLGAFVAGLILAGAIATGLSAQAAAPATTPVLNTAPHADHGWSSEAAPLAGAADGNATVRRAQSFYQPAGLSSPIYGESRGGFSRASNLAR